MIYLSSHLYLLKSFSPWLHLTNLSFFDTINKTGIIDNLFLTFILLLKMSLLLLYFEFIYFFDLDVYKLASFSMYCFNFNSSILYPVFFIIYERINGIKGWKNILGNPVLSDAIYNISFYKSLKGLSRTIPHILTLECFEP